MNVTEGNFKAFDGLNIFWKAWLPEGEPKAVIHLMHGYAEHVDRYTNVFEKLVPAGYAIFGTDHRGHGRSDGQRGYVKCMLDFVRDERQFSQEIIRKQFPGKKYFVLGHSMGSVIALRYVEEDASGVDGLVLSGSGAAPGPATPKYLQVVARVASVFLPKLSLKSPLPADFISRDPEVVKAYVDDPLTYDVVTPRLGEQLATYTVKNAADAGRVQVPFLLQCGTADTSFSGQKELCDAIGSNDKTFRFYEGLKHEVYNELPEDRKRVLNDLNAWLDAHV